MKCRLFKRILPLWAVLSLLAASSVQAKENVIKALPLAVEAYVYGYPLVTMEMTKRVLTNVAKPEAMAAPMGQFLRLRSYPTVEDRQVTAPNADTLYTTTWLDVSKEPWVISLPEANGRYSLFPMLDAWTNVFASPGKRTTGTGPQQYAVTGPGWKGKLPAGVKEYKSPTALIWVLGRIYCTGTPEDYDIVHKMQDAISAVPLSAYGKPYTPPPVTVDPSIDMRTPVREQVNALSATDYFNLLAKLLKDNPPAPADKAMVAKLAKIGIEPGKPFDAGKLGPLAKDALAIVPTVAQERIKLWMKEGIVTGENRFENGWLILGKCGSYGTDYVQRAMVTYYGLGANLTQDAVYPTSEGPSLIGTYSGEKKYVMRFPKGQLPPVDGFWSLTMYDKDYYFVKNPLNRQSISARDNLKANADGSVDLYIQNENPGPDKESNWLPAPKDTFVLMLRMYWPKEKSPSIVNNTWRVPGVKAVN